MPGFENYFAFCSEAGIDTKSDRSDPLVCSSAKDVKDIDDIKSWNENPRNTPFHYEDQHHDEGSQIIPVSEGAISNEIWLTFFAYTKEWAIYHSRK